MTSIPWPSPTPDWTKMTAQEMAEQMALDWEWLAGWLTSQGRHEDAKIARQHIRWCAKRSHPAQGMLL
jgi:hypothetical protein